MITQQLIEYIRQRVIGGASREDITKELLAVGWSAGDINKTFSAPEVMVVRSAKKNMSSEAPPNVSPETLHSEPSVGMYKDNVQNVQNVSPESISLATEPSVSQQSAESFVPPESLVSAQSPTIHYSFWYRPMVIILALVILMGVVGGGVYAYYSYTKQPSAIVVLRGAFENRTKVNSFDFAATSTSATVTNISPVLLSPGTRGIVSGTKLYATTTAAEHGAVVRGEDKMRPSFDILLALRGALSIATTSGTYSFGLHAVLSPKAFDLKLLRGNVSIESTNPQLRMGAVFVNATLEKISDKWVRLINFTATSSPMFSKMLFGFASSSPAVTKDLQALRAYADSLQYVHSAKNVGIEYLNGIPTYHLSLIIQNTPKSVLLLQRLLYDYSQSLYISKKTQSISFADFLQETNGLNKVLTQKIPIDIWIGKNDSRVYKFTIPSIAFVSVGDGQNSRMTLRVREEFRFDHYNTATSIVPPKNTESLQSFLGSVFGATFGGGSTGFKSATGGGYGSGASGKLRSSSAGGFKSGAYGTGGGYGSGATGGFKSGVGTGSYGTGGGR